MIRKILPPSIRFELREAYEWLKLQPRKIKFWEWMHLKFQRSAGQQHYVVHYIGRKNGLDLLKALLNISEEIHPVFQRLNRERTALVSEIPFPGALRVPAALRVILPLNRPLDEITAGFDNKLQRVLRNQRKDYRTRQVLDETEIEHVNRELLQPFAIARHGKTASQIGIDIVRKMALECGRLDVVISGEKTVGCLLGGVTARSGKNYWSLIRCGYIEEIFSDPRSLREANAVNFYLALEWAINNNFDFFDMGTCLGRPEDGLLQWKKRWGGLVDGMGVHQYLYVRLPRKNAAQFLWDAPLFNVDGKNIELHIGFPAGQDEENFFLRYREMDRGMGIGGLTSIQLHCSQQPSASLLEKVRSHYQHLTSPPELKVISSA